VKVVVLLVFVLLAAPLRAQPAAAGTNDVPHARACAACHGVNGVSIAAGLPNLAAQRADYIAAQLRAYRSGSRENALMNAIAAPLSDSEIDALARMYQGMPGPADGSASSSFLPELVRTEFPFPADYESTFVRYHTAYPGNQVRHYYANETALAAAREGRALPDGSYLIVEIFAATLGSDGQPVRGADGRFVAGERVGFNVMAREAGWGERIPELLRNENWNYANLGVGHAVNTGASQAACLACHVPLTDTSYVFTLEQLIAVARERD
jgi:cytochrome c553